MYQAKKKVGSFSKNVGFYRIIKMTKIANGNNTKGGFYQKNNSDNLK